MSLSPYVERIAEATQGIQAAKAAIASAITAKGGTVGASDGLADFAAAIAAIPGGGSGITGTEMTLAVDCNTWQKLLDALYPVQTGLTQNAVYLITPKTRAQLAKDAGVYFFGFTTAHYNTDGELRSFFGCRTWGGAPNVSTSKTLEIDASVGDVFVEYIIPRGASNA